MKPVYTVAVALGLITLSEAGAQQGTYPTRPLRLVLSVPPGGAADFTGRVLGAKLGEFLGQHIVIESRPGAGGIVASEYVTKATPDGYTFGVTPSLSVVILPHLRKTPYDPLKDLVPVVNMTTGTLLFAVHPTHPAKTLKEFVDYAKANPGKLSWGTAGVGSYGHLMCEAFKHFTGTDILHVPYRGGGESLADFLAGVHHIHADPNTFPHVTAGKAKLLAVSDLQRHPQFPDVPLMKEVYPDLDFVVWFAMYAPVGTPPAVVKWMNEEINKISREDAALRATLLKTALAPVIMTPDELGALTKSDHARYGELIKKLNIKAE